MGGAAEAVQHYASRLDLSFLREHYPQAVHRGRLISADQDIDPMLVPMLIDRYQAAACDWESGAIAWTAARNQVPCLILRAVSDVVSIQKGEVYDDLASFHLRAEDAMQNLLENLPEWIACSVEEK